MVARTVLRGVCSPAMTSVETALTRDDEIHAVLGGDMTVGLGYRTPARGVVVQAVAPIGWRDRAQRPPQGGTDPRVDAARAGRRVRGTRHALVGFAGADGRPVVLPVTVEAADAGGLRLVAATSLPPGGRRAGLLGHSYRPQLIGLQTRQYTGWLEVGEEGRGRYAPHTEKGYRAPPSKTLLLLLNGMMAKRGVRAARQAAAP